MSIKKWVKRILITFTVIIGLTAALALNDEYFEVSKNIDIFVTLFRDLNIYYVDDVKPGETMKVGIDAMLNSLDPYTNFYPESEVEDYRFITTGEYGGVGALIHQKGDKIYVSDVYENNPAYKAGIRAGDELLEINGKRLKGLSTDDVGKFMKGQANTNVRFTYLKVGETTPITVDIKREEIKVKNVPYFGMLNSTTGYIKLTGFTEKAAEEVKDAYTTLKNEKGMTALVFDLRDNPGGLLREAVDIVNLFADKGQDIVYSKGKVKEWDHTYKSVNNPVDLSIPIVVMVNHGSASASEIVSGSLQDLDRAVILGQRSYGKGLVQQTKPITYNAQFKVTVAKYYTPSGRCIQALDYSNRNEDGSVDKVPDSLITAFKTKHGRFVYDGAGIAPDVQTEEMKYSVVASELENKYIIFDYVTGYLQNHKTITDTKSINFSDQDYTEFTNFVKKQNFEYRLRSEKELDYFQKALDKDKLDAEVKAELETLKKKLASVKQNDLINFKLEIKTLIEQEIAARIGFQKGRIESSFKSDAELQEAIKVVSNKEQVTKILTTVVASTKPLNPNNKFK